MGRRERVGREVLGYYSSRVPTTCTVGSRLWSSDGGSSRILRGFVFLCFLASRVV